MAYAWVEQRKCAKDLGVGVYKELLTTDKSKDKASSFPKRHCKSKEKGLFQLDQDTPITAFDVLTQNIQLNFLESSATEEPPKYDKTWVPLDAAMHDAEENPSFLQEITEYVDEKTALFWKRPETYFAMQQGSSGAPNCIIAFEKLVSKFPFLALMPSHSASPANTTETLVFYQLADRSSFRIGNGVRYTTLSSLVKWFLDLKIMRPIIKKIARDLVVFVHDHSKFLRYQALDGTRQAAKKVQFYSGGSILKKFNHLQMSKVSVEWLKSVKFDNPRLQTQDLAKKILHHPRDASMLAWYETGASISGESPDIAHFELRINKASSSADHITQAPGPPSHKFAKKPRIIGPSPWSSNKRQKTLSQLDVLLIVAEEMLGCPSQFALAN